MEIRLQRTVSASLVHAEEMCTIIGILGECKTDLKGVKKIEQCHLVRCPLLISRNTAQRKSSERGKGSRTDLSIGLWLVPSKETKNWTLLMMSDIVAMVLGIGRMSTETLGRGYGYNDDRHLGFGWDDDGEG
ncbi:hypothetical protein PM082_006184 [Marasmius tenuissimus]|nr:hypothetical protein PM082_006184 [Marasmius tenuissimus]